MKLYELSYLISPELSEEESKDLSQKMSGFLSREGKIEKTDDLFKKRLGHPIDKKTEAYLGVFEFRFAPEKTKELEEKLRADKKYSIVLISISPYWSVTVLSSSLEKLRTVTKPPAKGWGVIDKEKVFTRPYLLVLQG